MTNKSLKFLFALPLVALPASMMAQPVYTDPVGAVSFAGGAGGYIMSAPMQHAKLFQGSISGIAGEVVTMSGSVPELSGAIYAQVISGASAGVIVNVVAATGSDVTLESAAGLSVGDVVALRPHFTIADLGELPDFSSVSIFNADGSVVDGSFVFGEWDIPVDTVIYPGEGFVLTAGDDFQITFLGSVAVDPVVVPLAAGGISNFVGTLNPVSSPASNAASFLETFGGLPDFSSVSIYALGDLTDSVAFDVVFGEWSGDVSGVDLSSPKGFVVVTGSPSSITVGGVEVNN